MPRAHDIFKGEVDFPKYDIVDQTHDWYYHKNPKQTDEIDVTTISSK